MSIILKPDEIQEITGKIRFKTQVATLRAMGFNVITRPDGSPIVLRDDFKNTLSGQKRISYQLNQSEPDFSTLLDAKTPH